MVKLKNKVERGLTALALATLVGLEKKQRERVLQERLKRLEQRKLAKK